MTTEVHRTHFTRSYCRVPAVGLCVDVSRMNYADTLLADTAELMQRAFEEMDALESGAIANADEQRMVGHYWLRAPQRAPDDEIRRTITETVEDIKRFAAEVHAGRIAAPDGRRFGRMLSIGIGGSALGPQFVGEALGRSDDPLSIHFIDNADPDGIDRVFARIGDELPTTLVLVISKSGGTPETRNGMLECKHRFEAAGLDFARHAVAITGDDGALREIAEAEQWLKTFPMWDWVGGRTSELSAVGLVPAALQGFDIDAMLAGAGACDEATRVHDVLENPAALLAMMWYHVGEGRGAKDMVVLPYRDRLGLFSRYLQQLVMESLGKKVDRQGKVVHQGLAVYGNKGSTDQHAYVQQLRDGLNNFFVTFIEVLRDREGESMFVEEDVTAGDYLHGFLLGTRDALYNAGRESITITLDDVTPRSVGALIALFERAVGFYASLINVNAYHQPGVEAGKKAASDIIGLQRQLLAAMRAEKGTYHTARDWAEGIGASDRPDTVFKILRHLAANPDRGVVEQTDEHVDGERFGIA